ncbi:uncharacterized protein N7511_009367 [Penicillium nucicola]|uniref:uncharacterized protein n=1 Tax=Penicillium nucicola TaxID=1850975 RepID=UPI00254588F8|nr:uncharacterized protein N7511_009367 [Penicillium nucicola]KAJ5747671.1 hypothetical protein N7511_009367 [Penicillium nucicola]
MAQILYCTVAKIVMAIIASVGLVGSSHWVYIEYTELAAQISQISQMHPPAVKGGAWRAGLAVIYLIVTRGRGAGLQGSTGHMGGFT